jgi:hypothetical protein
MVVMENLMVELLLQLLLLLVEVEVAEVPLLVVEEVLPLLHQLPQLHLYNQELEFQVIL